MTAKTVLVLGGGVGGLVATDHLRCLLPSEHRVFSAAGELAGKSVVEIGCGTGLRVEERYAEIFRRLGIRN